MPSNHEPLKIPLLPYHSAIQDFVRCCEEGKNIIKEYPNSPAGMGLMDIARSIHTHNNQPMNE